VDFYPWKKAVLLKIYKGWKWQTSRNQSFFFRAYR